MADAGRILIIPRGDYDANSTYDKLDLVKYKGTSWLAKKNATGVEPSEGEYWQNMFDISISPTQNPNMTITGYEGSIEFAKNGKVVQVSLRLFVPEGQTIPSWSSIYLGILPEGYRPALTINEVPVLVHGREVKLLLEVNPYGEIKLNTMEEAVTFGDGSAVRGGILFIVA